MHEITLNDLVRPLVQVLRLTADGAEAAKSLQSYAGNGDVTGILQVMQWPEVADAIPVVATYVTYVLLDLGK